MNYQGDAVKLEQIGRISGIAAAVLVLTAHAAEAPTKIEWRTLRGLNCRTGEQSPEIKKINQVSVKIPGLAFIPLAVSHKIGILTVMLPVRNKA